MCCLVPQPGVGHEPAADQQAMAVALGTNRLEILPLAAASSGEQSCSGRPSDLETPPGLTCSRPVACRPSSCKSPRAVACRPSACLKLPACYRRSMGCPARLATTDACSWCATITIAGCWPSARKPEFLASGQWSGTAWVSCSRTRSWARGWSVVGMWTARPSTSRGLPAQQTSCRTPAASSSGRGASQSAVRPIVASAWPGGQDAISHILNHGPANPGVSATMFG